MFLKTRFLFLPCKGNNWRPYIFKTSFLFYYFLFLLFLRIVILPFYVYFPKDVFFAKVVNSTLFELTNQERKSFGVPTLRQDSWLEKAAFYKAQHMLQNNYFDHKSPEGLTGWYWIKKAGYDYKIAGENLAIGFLDSEEVHKAWNHSSPHRQNLLNPEFQDVGIAVLRGDFEGRPTTVVVQFLGSPKIAPPVQAQESEVPKQAREEKEVTLKQKEVLGRPKQVSFLEGELKEESFGLSFWKFMSVRYNLVIRQLILFSLIFIGGIFVLELLVQVWFGLSQGWLPRSFFDLAPEFLFCIGLVILLVFFEKETILSLFPHNLRI